MSDLEAERRRFLGLLEKADLLMASGNFHAATRAWGYMFYALALSQQNTSATVTREMFVDMAGRIHDQVFRILGSGVQS